MKKDAATRGLLLLSPFLFLLLLGGCVATGKPMVWVEKNASLTGYKVFEVIPVLNETGKTFEFDITDTLTQNLKARLRDKGYIVTEENVETENVLILKSNLIGYELGSAFQRWVLPGAGTTQSTVKSSLIDRKTGKILGEIVTAKAISEGGLFSIGADQRILEIVTIDIINEIDKKVKS